MTTDNLEQEKNCKDNSPFSITYFALLKRKVFFFPLQMRQYDGEIKLNGDVIPLGQNNSIQ